MDAIVSYIAVAGNDLRFNISLKPCTTLNCSDERITLRGPDNTVIDDTVIDGTVVDGGRTILTPSEEDLSIFIIIGSTLAALALCCLLFIFGIRKMNE